MKTNLHLNKIAIAVFISIFLGAFYTEIFSINYFPPIVMDLLYAMVLLVVGVMIVFSLLLLPIFLSGATKSTPGKAFPFNFLSVPFDTVSYVTVTIMMMTVGWIAGYLLKIL